MPGPEYEHHYAYAHGVRLHYAALGSGRPVVLLHGFPETHRSWDLQAPFLAERGFRAIVPDLRGYGESDHPRGGYDLESLAADVARLIDRVCGGRALLVGHDWGGAITWIAAERYASRVERAVVIACPHPSLMARALRTNRAQLRRSWYIFFFQLPLLPALWLTMNEGEKLGAMWRRGAEPELVAAERAALARVGSLRGPLSYYRQAFRENVSSLWTGRTRYDRSRVEVPISLIWGAQDACLGVELMAGHERIAQRLRTHVVADAGHFVHQERPGELNRLLLDALTVACPEPA
jgi:pimeloyl-ACP methyl ester carboxylesterase